MSGAERSRYLDRGMYVINYAMILYYIDNLEESNKLINGIYFYFNLSVSPSYDMVPAVGFCLQYFPTYCGTHLTLTV